MAEGSIQNWKEKYLVALEEFEASHKQDQQRLDILRRGLVRVSLAADGLDSTLDEQLAELRTNLRGSRDIRTLEPLVSDLERTIVALDDRRKQDHEALQSLLDTELEQYLALDLPRQDKSTIRKLRKQLPELITSNGMQLSLWQQLTPLQAQIQRSLQDKIDQMNQNRRGLLSRLFRGDKPVEPMTSAVDDDEPDSDAALANLDQVDGEDVPLPDQSGAAGADDETNPQHLLAERLSRIICNLLEQLEVPGDYLPRKARLEDRVKSEFALDDLPEILDETTQLIASTRMMAQKEFEGFLVALHQRLQDIQQFLETAKAGEEQSIRNQEKLDADVRKELLEIRTSVEGGDDIGRLRHEIEGMVNRIVAAVDSFHHEEKQRRADVFGRIEQLAKRMESMEAEATELKSSLEAQRLEAMRDALTELPNRAAYDDAIEREYSRWRRHGRPLSICVVDIDHFKQINDSLGHLRGDKVLKLVAREISRRVRNEDFVARYGGEEFVILMPETDQQSAMAAAEKVRLAIAECPFNFNNERLLVTASFGVASFMEGDTIESCFERADRALYRAKANGRNQVERG
ncbi:MAG: GGDEF domain-containing protein [Gammaproteobacteria bacterium]|jgi:diguanylate cyclase